MPAEEANDACQLKLDPSKIGVYSHIVEDILQKHDIHNLSLQQSQHIIRHFTVHTIIFQHLKMVAIETYKNRQDHKPDVKQAIDQLNLNEDLIVAMFGGTRRAISLKNKIEGYRKGHEEDMILYYILKGCVDSVDVNDRKQVLDRYKE